MVPFNIILGDTSGEYMLLSLTTLGFAGLQILAPRGKCFHHGTKKKVLINFKSWLLHVILVSSCQEIHRKGNGEDYLILVIDIR